MIKVSTGSDLIIRYEEVIPPDVCESIIRYMKREKPDRDIVADGPLPWHMNDTIPFVGVRDRHLRATIDRYRFLFTQLGMYAYGTVMYPHFTDLVVWRKGMKMAFHKDNGYEGPDEEMFRPRAFSMVAYLNDNYVGGETVIKQDNKPDFISTPKQGSLVFFKSNEECIHSVNEVIEGTRYTLATWFAVDINKCEVVV